jgi:hypothetical protein
LFVVLISGGGAFLGGFVSFLTLSNEKNKQTAKLRITFQDTNTPNGSRMHIKLAFGDGGRDEFLDPLMAALNRRAWQDEKPATIDSHLPRHPRKLQKKFVSSAASSPSSATSSMVMEH